MPRGAVVQGLTSDRTWQVEETDTAAAVGSGDLPVLGTPRLLAWMEGVTCTAIEPCLAEGETSVGTRMTLEHQAPSSVGARVTVTATVQQVDGRLVRFDVAAAHEDGDLVGHAQITRVIVDRARFLGRMP